MNTAYLRLVDRLTRRAVATPVPVRLDVVRSGLVTLNPGTRLDLARPPRHVPLTSAKRNVVRLGKCLTLTTRRPRRRVIVSVAVPKPRA